MSSALHREEIPGIRKGVRNLLLVAAPTCGILLLLAVRSSAHSLEGPLHLRWQFVGILAALALLKWAVDSCRFWLIARLAGAPISCWHSIQVYLASVFAANVTPFYAGGLATQTFFLSSGGGSPGVSAAVGTLYAVFNLVVNLVFALAVLIWTPVSLLGARRLAFVGLAMVMALLSALAVLLLSHLDGAEKLLRSILKHRPAAGDAAVRGLRGFSDGVRTFLTGHGRAMTGILGISMISQLLSLAFTPLAFRALGMWNVSCRQIVLTQIGVQLSSSMGATPGGAGIVEGSFGLFFQPLAGPATSALTLLWRSATFYLPTLVGAGMFVWLIRGEPDAVRHRVVGVGT